MSREYREFCSSCGAKARPRLRRYWPNLRGSSHCALKQDGCDLIDADTSVLPPFNDAAPDLVPFEQKFVQLLLKPRHMHCGKAGQRRAALLF
jgi:hypothetical protein